MTWIILVYIATLTADGDCSEEVIGDDSDDASDFTLSDEEGSTSDTNGKY